MENLCKNPSTTSMEEAVHLILLQHGLHGSPQDYSAFQPVLETVLQGQEIYIHPSQCNSKEYFTTHDGIDSGGVRLADEVESIVAQCPNLRKISFIGHSLGGLYIRYCIGVLYARGFFLNIQPINFITIATPNMGIRRPPNRGSFNTLFNTISSKLFHRTGEQLTVKDIVSEDTLALASIHTLLVEKPFEFPDIQSQLDIQLPSPNDGFHSLYATIESKNEFSIYFSHLDIEQPPLFRFNISEFDLLLFIPTQVQDDTIDIVQDEFQPLFYPSEHEIPNDIVLQLKGRNMGDEICFEICISNGTDWKFVQNLILRLGTIHCVGYNGDRMSIRELNLSLYKIPQKKHLLQCLCQGAFLYGLYGFKRRVLYSNIFFDLQAPYSCSSFRSYNPYRNNIVSSTTSPIYRHITLNSIDNARILRDSIHFVSFEEIEEKPKNWFQGLVDIPTYIFPTKKNPAEIEFQPIQQRIYHVVSEDSEEIIIDSPENCFLSDPIRDILRGMLINMQCLPWERIDVHIESMIAHERIIAKRSQDVPTSESGIDIVHHIADTFSIG